MSHVGGGKQTEPKQRFDKLTMSGLGWGHDERTGVGSPWAGEGGIAMGALGWVAMSGAAGNGQEGGRPHGPPLPRPRVMGYTSGA